MFHATLPRPPCSCCETACCDRRLIAPFGRSRGQ